MKITKIDMSKVTDGKPFSNAVWEEATLEEENKFRSILSSIIGNK